MNLRAIGLAALWPLLLGCGPSLSYAYMAKDSKGSMKTTQFHSLGEEIHLVMEVLGGDEETVLTMDFFGPGGISLTDEEYYPRPDPTVTEPVQIDIQLYQIDPMGEKLWEGPWPLGAYKIDVLLDDELQESLDFDVVN